MVYVTYIMEWMQLWSW